jgi:predicted amidohydrolase
MQIKNEIVKIACIQMTSGPEIGGNLKASVVFIREAAAQGAQLIATPENTDQMRRKSEDKLVAADSETVHPVRDFYSALAKELGVWLLIGSIGVRVSETQLANRSHLFAPDGSLAAAYDKIHMFDVKLSRTEFYNESKDNRAGDRAVVADMGFAKLGMSICYDVRFPHLHRDLAKAGAQILSVPAAFTVPTGKAHWEVLLRARAIETGSFVIAPAQVGEHEGGRLTYGHSMIIGPWGEILAQKAEGTGFIIAEIDLSEVEKARNAIPALKHDKPYEVKA